MADTHQTERFVQNLAEAQNRLYGYVFSLVGNHARAADVVQETNLVLWRKIDEFAADKPFLPWAFAIARFQVLAHLRDQNRDRMLLDPELLDALGEQAEQQSLEFDEVRIALRTCLSLLPANQRELVDHRFARTLSMQQIADATNRTVSSVKVALMRIRRQLAECIEQRLAGDSA